MDSPHDIDEQASRLEHEEPADFDYDEGSGSGPSTMDGAVPMTIEQETTKMVRDNSNDPLTRAHRLDDPCTIGLAVRIAKEIVREERWHRRLARWWRRRLVQLRRTPA